MRVYKFPNYEYLFKNEDIFSVLYDSGGALKAPELITPRLKELEAEGLHTTVFSDSPETYTVIGHLPRPVLPESKVIISTDFSYPYSRGVIGCHFLRFLIKNGISCMGIQDAECLKEPLIPDDLDSFISFDPPKVIRERDIIIRIDHIIWNDYKHHSRFHKLMDGPGLKWGYFFHESTQLPAKWISELNHYDEVFFVSRFCADVAMRSGFGKAARILPHGYDPDVFYPATERTERPFTFLSVASQQRRKGTLELIEAFSKTFGETDEPVQLILKDTGDGFASVYGKNITTDKISVIDSIYSDKELGDLYRRADCFVFPSYCEGFGLPVLEAKACRLPVITVPYSGLLDFCDFNDTIFYDYRPITESAWMGGVDSTWAKPDVESLGRAMRLAYENEEERERLAKNGYERIRRMTWDNVLTPLFRRIKSS